MLANAAAAVPPLLLATDGCDSGDGGKSVTVESAAAIAIETETAVAEEAMGHRM